MFAQNIDVFVKIFIFVRTQLSYKYCDCFLNKKNMGSNFVERIKEWFSAKDIRFMERKVQLGTLHIWINSHIFHNH